MQCRNIEVFFEGTEVPSFIEVIFMIIPEQIQFMAEQHLAGSDKFVVHVKVRPGNRILVFIDSDTAVSIADCAQLSKFIESNLNRDKEDFELEVSSAGLDFPLTLKRQYKKNIGKEIKIICKNGIVNNGVIIDVSEDNFTISKNIETKINKKKIITQELATLAFEEIKETKLVVKI